MKSARSVFQAGLADLRWYIQLVELEWKLLAAATAVPPCSAGDDLAAKLKSHVGMGVAKRRFDYISIVIALYGLLEQYVESLVNAYLSQINNVIPKYSELPESVRNNHVAVSFKLIEKAMQTRFRGSVTPEELIANLHACLNVNEPYKINADAYCLHTANFRTEAIDEIFGRLGIGNVMGRLHFFQPFYRIPCKGICESESCVYQANAEICLS